MKKLVTFLLICYATYLMASFTVAIKLVQITHPANLFQFNIN